MKKKIFEFKEDQAHFINIYSDQYIRLQIEFSFSGRVQNHACVRVYKMVSMVEYAYKFYWFVFISKEKEMGCIFFRLSSLSLSSNRTC